ncbi:WD40-repeat-containing domain protein [Suillus spraguei]|nr:WD40-repeat-containing domain protein [Suillus spraguei]
MTSVSMKAATTQSILKKVATLKGHGKTIHSISYFPDGQRMISGSLDKTTRQWDLKAGEEIEGARDVCKNKVYVVAVSRDGRWVVTGGGDLHGGELTSCDVKTGIVKIFEGHSREVNTVDISADSTLLASGSDDKTVRIWNLETGKLVAGPFKSIGRVGAVRFSPDFKKLAVKLDWGVCLEVWDIQSCKLDVRIGNPNVGGTTLTPVFWTNKNKDIIAAFEFCSTEFQDLYDLAKTIYEFDAVTLETVGTAFEGHTNTIWGLTLSLDGALLASASYDNTIKLWAFVSRELLASFDIQNPFGLMLSSDSLQLVYTTHTKDDYKICICDTPPNILAQARVRTCLLFICYHSPYYLYIISRKKSVHRHLLNSDVTCRPPAGHRRPPISVMPIASRTLPKIDSQQPTFLRLRKLLPFSSGANVVPVVPYNLVIS